MFGLDTPEGLPLRGGLLNVPEVDLSEDEADRLVYLLGRPNTGTKYRGALCGPVRRIPTDGSDKTFDRQDDVTPVAFGVYHGAQSALMESAAATVTDDAFTARESYGVEQAVQELLLNPNATDITPTPGTAVTLPNAVALAEQYAADNYGGLPLLHVNRYGAAVMGGSLEQQGRPDWTLYTKQGTPVANGGGYGSTGPGAVVAGAGNFWLYVTGRVHLWRGSLVKHEARALGSNYERALVERQYAASVDCFVAAILTTN